MTLSSILFIFTSSFMALFPVSNPIGISFIINESLSDVGPDQQKLAIKKIITYFILIGLGSLLIGHLLLLLFGLAIPVIQLAGGLLICKTAIGLLDGDGSTSNEVKNATQNISDDTRWKTLQAKLFYPITFPLAIGPGTVSVIFTVMASASVAGKYIQTTINYAIIALAIICLAAVLYLSLTQGRRISIKLGESGMMILNKMVAFFTFCIGIQIIVTGISKIFHLDIL